MSDVITHVRHASVEEVKTAALAATKIDAPGEQPGTFAAFVNVTNIIDHDNDKIMPGAFGASLATRNPKVFWGHDPNVWIGKTLSAEELAPGDPRLPESIRNVGGGALWVRGQFNLDTQAGREAYSNAKFFGNDVEWSVGFRIPKDGARIDVDSGIRVIEKVDLYEYSMVYAGASPGTHTQTIKQTAVSADDLKDDIQDDQIVEFVLEDGTVLRGMFRIVEEDTPDESEEEMSDSTEATEKASEDVAAQAYASGRSDAMAEIWATAEWLHAELDAWTVAESAWKTQLAEVDDVVVDDVVEVEPVAVAEVVEVDDEVDDTLRAEIEALELENDIAAGDLL